MASLPSGVVVIERTAPHEGCAHVLVELIVQGHGSQGIGVQDAGTAGHIGHLDGLKAHAHFQIRVRHCPVDIGIEHAHDLAVAAKGAAGFGLTPGRFKQLEEHCAGQVLGGNCVQLQTHTLHGAELVVVVVLALGVAGTGFVDKACVATAKAHQPFALGLEFNCVCRRNGSGKEETGSQNQSH